MSLIHFHTVKCRKCGYKFSLSSDKNCDSCKFLGISCIHKNICAVCLGKLSVSQIKKLPVERFKARMYFGTLIAITLTAYYGIGVKLF